LTVHKEGAESFEESILELERAAARDFDADLIETALLFARRCGARAEDAEDLAQDALIKLLTYGGTIERPAAWLYVVVRRLHLRRLRAAHRPPPGGTAWFDPWPAVELGIDARRLLARVSPKSRASLRLSFAGYTERETAALVGSTVTTTEKSLHRARCQLRRMLTAPCPRTARPTTNSEQEESHGRHHAPRQP
jgi:DNA-directed RNA polymerase specialized sigma24 family protein